MFKKYSNFFCKKIKVTTDSGDIFYFKKSIINTYPVLHNDNDNPAIERMNGSKHWYVDGKLHRDNDNPAIIRMEDSDIIENKIFLNLNLPNRREWYKKGKKHRENDKPAVEYIDYYLLNKWKIGKEFPYNKEYYINDKLSRLNDKPAIEMANGKHKYVYLFSN
jgi:hypothetical protein